MTPANNFRFLFSKVESGPAEGESGLMEREVVSAVERERTMRDLMDVQRKVEQRHRRDRERQILRVRGTREEVTPL